jgi:hypothetical protein
VEVLRPDGTVEVVPLRDDGCGGHRNDGLYEARYRNFTGGSGVHGFTVRVQCRQGTAHIVEDEEFVAGRSPGITPVHDFDRIIRFSGTVKGVPDNLPPHAAICTDVRKECEGVRTEVPLDGRCSSDPEGEPLSYEWSSPTGDFDDPYSPTPVGLFPVGRNEASLVVRDPHGVESEPDPALVVVADTTPPVIAVTLHPDSLWPPNHRMVDVTAQVDVVDTCDEAPAVVLVSITSDEPDDAPGAGDGATVDDIQDADIGTADLSFRLRAERAASGDGRVYTVTYAVTDASGNPSTSSATVTVAHDRGGKTDPIELTVSESHSGTLVEWNPVEDAVSYNVIRGRCEALHESGSIIELGSVICIEARSLDQTTAGLEDLEMPSPGASFFYLVEYETADGQRSSFGSESVSKPREPSTGDCL